MQLFVVAYRRDGSAGELGLGTALAAVAAVFPQLVGGEETSGTGSDGRLAFGAISHPARLAGPRRYATRRGSVVTLLDGLPVEREGRFAARDAAILAERWTEAPGALEGIFSAVRMDLEAGEAQCLTDPLGMAKVYFSRDAGGWLLSNSVEALRRVGGLDRLDPLGTSALISLGWPADRTLIDGVRPLAGGCLHTLGAKGHRERRYFDAAAVAPRRNDHRIGDARELAERLEATAAAAVAGIEPLSCPLTAGRDTRVLFALMLALGMRSADYYTSGLPGEPDVEIARVLAAAAGVEHRRVTPQLPANADAWVAASARFARQTEGMATLYGIADHVDHGVEPAPLGLKIWGPGGEIARAGNIGMLIPFVSQVPGLRHSWEVQKRTLETKTSDRGGIVRPEALEATRRYLRDFADRRREEGWRPREVLEAYYAFERVPDWASTGVRRVSGATDLFAPFVSSDFYEYAFSLSAGERYVEAAHYRLLSVLDERLRDMPFEKPWKPQRPRLAPLLAIAGAAGAVSRRLPGRGGRGAAGASVEPLDFGGLWLEAGIDRHRELCASVPDSPLWDYVDRRRLEVALAGPPASRAPWTEGLCAVLTPFWYLHGQDAPA
jgi:asparagine synthase (glutamine-hydrolysing)